MRREGVEPPPTGWKPVILPLNYRRSPGIFEISEIVPYSDLANCERQGGSERKLRRRKTYGWLAFLVYDGPVNSCLPVYFIQSHLDWKNPNSSLELISLFHRTIHLHGFRAIWFRAFESYLQRLRISTLSLRLAMHESL
jgi:hypothetical protein